MYRVLLLVSVLGVFGGLTLYGLQDRPWDPKKADGCPIRKVVESDELGLKYCTKCEVLLGDDEYDKKKNRCNGCDGRVKSVKVCAGEYGECEVCGRISLKKERCHEKAMKTKYSPALIFNECEICGGRALWPSNYVEHDEQRHIQYECMHCFTQSTSPMVEHCNARDIKTVFMPKQIRKKVCSKSGRFPHVISETKDMKGARKRGKLTMSQ